MTQPKSEETPDVEMEEAVPKAEDATKEDVKKEEDNKVTEDDDDDDDSEDGLPVKKLAAMKNYGKGTPATKVKMCRKSAAPVRSPIEASESLDFEEETEKSKVVKAKRKATTNSKKKGKDKETEETSPKEEGKKGKQQKPKSKESPSAANETASASSDKQNEDDDFAACCLCHCALDYSDRSAFFEADRKQEADKNASGSDDEPLYFQPTDPYLPASIYDPSNALVYCDTCDRLYHQKCHFVPLMVLPRGKWSCLVCATKNTLTNGSNPGGRGRKNGAAAAATKKDAPFTKHKLSRMFKSPLPPTKLQQYLTEGGENNTSKKYHMPAEKEWEIATGREKAILWHKTLTQTIPSWIQSQFGNLNQAQTALETLTTTKLNRQHFLAKNKASKRGSQELAQTLVKLTGAKWKMRQMVLQMEEIRANPEKHIQLIQQWCQQGGTSTGKKEEEEDKADASNALARPPPKSFMDRVIFPFGQYPPRTIPRTPEMQEHLEMEAKKQTENAEKSEKLEKGIPMEIVTTTTASAPKESPTKAANESPTKSSKKSEKMAKSPKRHSKTKCKPADAKNDDDSGSGVSLEDLVCAVCLIGDASDENDLLLCDAQGCFRAYHMQCLEPIVTLKEVEATQGEDWFCPLCSGMADCVHKIQSYYMGEEWDRRREARAAAAKKAGKKRKPEKEEENDDNDDDSDEDSLKSWEKPTDVFPDSEWEYETALELKAGKQTDATDTLLREALGEGDEEQQQQGNLLDYLSDGTDDVELDGHFDLESFHEERKREYEEMADSDDDSADDDSSHSSEATLVDMSSVELKIGKDELDCLSQGSMDSDSDDDSGSGSGSGSDDDGSGGSESGGEVRRSRRIRKLQNPVEIPKNVGVDFDPGNIVQGKRRRKPVDYRKLNDALFGDLDDKENAKLDDKEDFQVQVQPKRVRKKKAFASSGEEGSDDDEGSGDSDNEDNNEGSDAGGSKENGKDSRKKKKKASRKRSRAPSDDEDVGSGNEAENDDSSVEGSKDKKKKSATKPPAKRKRGAPPKSKKAGAAKKNGAKPSEENGKKEANGKKAPKKQNGKKTAGATKKQNGTKGAKKAKETKSKTKTATNAKKMKAEGAE